MHPAMAVWIWSMAMARAWQGSSPWEIAGPNDRDEPRSPRELNPVRPATRSDQTLVLANGYLHSEIAEVPLPSTLLDRLADLYWTEKDAELAI